MKKRRQLPNVRTFTILFRGLIRAENPQYAVYESMKYYNVLLNDKRLEPSTIHLNAVLNVCAKAGDLDSMFLVADSIKEDGVRAPDATTYSIILHALRHHAHKETRDMSIDEKKVYHEELVSRAKMIWSDVIKRWNAGKMVIDEELVCIMGRLVLMSPKLEEKRQVLFLLNQTMCMPNIYENPDSNPYADESMKGIGAAGPSKALPSGKGVYATPGKNTISLVLKTLAMTRLTNVGIKYWNLMVRHYGIIPDEDNWMYMLHMLQVAKASNHAANILDIMPDEYLAKRHFKSAMEACVRDNVNVKAIKASNKILDTMMEKLDSPDVHSLRLYLRASLVNHHRLRLLAQKGKEEEAKKAYGLQITEALTRLWEPYKKVYWQVFSDANPADPAAQKVQYNDKREVIALARQMFSAFNKVINEKMLPEEDLAGMRPIGAKINRSIQTFYSNREDIEPKLNPKQGKGASQGADDDAAPSEEELASAAASDNKYGSILEEAIGDYKPKGDFIWDTTKSEKDAVKEAKRAERATRTTRTTRATKATKAAQAASTKTPAKRGRPRKIKEDEGESSSESSRAPYPWESKPE